MLRQEVEVFDAEKFKELVLYLAERESVDPAFGAVKLNKILYFSDFEAYLRFGSPITGATYVAQRLGPVPREMPRMQQQLETEERAHMEHRDRFGMTQKRLVAKKPADISCFEPEQIALVDSVADFLRKFNATDASEFSHQTAVGWQVAREGEEIPYFAAFLTGEPPTQEDIDEGVRLAQENDWLAAV
jgi:hypothetical protein